MESREGQVLVLSLHLHHIRKEKNKLVTPLFVRNFPLYSCLSGQHFTWIYIFPQIISSSLSSVYVAARYT